MKKFIYIILTFLVCLTLSSSTYIVPIDHIEYYEVKVDPRKDGTLDMQMQITWKVLDDDSEGPLEWVMIGIPNYHVDELVATSTNIKKIKYYADNGSYIRLDFKRAYKEGETLSFSFTFHQSYMYQFDDNYCYYDYNPGWFEEIKVDKSVVLWNKTGIIEDNSESISGDYLKWEHQLDYGQRIKVDVKYNVDYFSGLNKEKQYTDEYLTPLNKLMIICIIMAFIGFFGFLIYSSLKARDPYMTNRGFCGGYVNYYLGYRRGYYSTRVSRSGHVIANPYVNSSGSGHSSGGGGCACACACACAGGGRAGCSRKDFYKAKVKETSLEKALIKKD